ncbi:hypothetical protein IHE44_0007730, partial [Lamprotornis superbus]
MRMSPKKKSSENETKDGMACRAKVAVSESQRYAVFFLFRIGVEVFDTEVTIVDEAITDICFENVIIFDEASPDFQVKVELYSCCTEESLYITDTPKKLAKKLKTSLSKAPVKKLKVALKEDSTEPLLPADPVIHGAKYSLPAHTTLGLESAEDNFRTHSLTITGNEESSLWLPLYGNMCCCLVVQPSCMARDMMAGFLNQKQMVGGLTSWRGLYCILRCGKLLCYYSPEEIEAKVEPALTVSINKDSKRSTNNFSVINPMSGEGLMQHFATDSRDELHKWMDAFWHHFYDLSQWKHCCEELMKIEIMSPRKPPLFLTKEATSIYHDISIDSPVKHEGLSDVIQRKIEESDGEFLLGQQKESASALWASLFDGSHEMTVQKNMHLNPKRDITTEEKKRRALPPPSDKSPYSAKTLVNTEWLGKENWRKPDHTSASSSSFESVLVMKMQQLQTPTATPRKIGPCGKSGLADLENPISLMSKTKSETKPVPTPREKGITEILDLRLLGGSVEIRCSRPGKPPTFPERQLWEGGQGQQLPQELGEKLEFYGEKQGRGKPFSLSKFHFVPLSGHEFGVTVKNQGTGCRGQECSVLLIAVALSHSMGYLTWGRPALQAWKKFCSKLGTGSKTFMSKVLSISSDVSQDELPACCQSSRPCGTCSQRHIPPGSSPLWVTLGPLLQHFFPLDGSQCHSGLLLFPLPLLHTSTFPGLSFKAGMHKLQHTSLSTSFNENGRSRGRLFTHVWSKQKAKKPGLCNSGPAGGFWGLDQKPVHTKRDLADITQAGCWTGHMATLLPPLPQKGIEEQATAGNLESLYINNLNPNARRNFYKISQSSHFCKPPKPGYGQAMRAGSSQTKHQNGIPASSWKRNYETLWEDGEVRQAVPPLERELKHRTNLTAAGNHQGKNHWRVMQNKPSMRSHPPAPLQPPVPIAAFVCHGQTLVPVKEREKKISPLKIHHLTVLDEEKRKHGSCVEGRKKGLPPLATPGQPLLEIRHQACCTWWRPASWARGPGKLAWSRERHFLPAGSKWDLAMCMPSAQWGIWAFNFVPSLLVG